MFENLREQNYQILALHHAEAILEHDLGIAVDDIEAVLSEVKIPVEELVRGGGGEGKLTQYMRNALAEFGWFKHNFEIKRIVDGVEKESISHEIDHVKRFDAGTFALEIEWNNKDPFYDRDLENFKRLHADGVISIGGIITRGETLHGEMRRNIERFAISRNIKQLDDLTEYYEPTSKQKSRYLKAEDRFNSFAKGMPLALLQPSSFTPKPSDCV